MLTLIDNVHRHHNCLPSHLVLYVDLPCPMTLLYLSCSQHALCHASRQMLHVCVYSCQRQQCTKLAPGPGSDLVPCMSHAATAAQSRCAAPCRSCICCTDIQSASHCCCPQLRQVNYSDSETICTASNAWFSCMLVKQAFHSRWQCCPQVVYGCKEC